MRRDIAYASGGVVCLALAGALYGYGQHETEMAKPVPPALRITVTATMPACVYLEGKADRKCNPGAINPNVTQANIHETICKKYWTDSIRPSTGKIRNVQMMRYGMTAANPGKEIREDHIISLELGGAPANPDNLYPQRYADSITKDREEDRLHAEVCSGHMDLATAQQTIMLHWTH